MGGFKSVVLAAFALPALTLAAPAPMAHAQYPHYLHAISDLRSARAYLEMDTRPETASARELAVKEIIPAIEDMKKVARDDGKNPWVTPPPQSSGHPSWPIHSALKLLKEAHDEVENGEETSNHAGLQLRSIQHINRALELLQPLK